MKVLIADDQQIVREGLATILGTMPGIELVGLAADGSEAIALVVEQAPDVVLMDLRMPKMDGAEATRLIRSQYPGTQVVVLTTFADDDSIMAALSAGALGYLTKDATREDIGRALEAAMAGQSILDPSVQASLLEAAQAARAGVASSDRQGILPAPAVLPDGLTEREVEVLALISEGLSNTEIASRLFVAETTVKTHINRIFAKTHSRDRLQAVAYARRHGLTAS